MTRVLPCAWLTLLLVTQPAVAQDRPKPTKPPAGLEAMPAHASGSHGAVVAGGAEAVAAGLACLKEGGNAVDAAVTTLLAQTVTDSSAFCFGGEVPILVYDTNRGVVEVIAGQGVAPRLATREHFDRPGAIPASGVEAAAVPATLDALLTALDRYGTRKFAEVAAATLRILERREQPWHADLARTIRRLIKAEAGSTDRRRGLRLAADAFYRGPIAREIDAWSRTHGGLIRYSDLAAHVTRVEEPVTADYRGFTVVKCGPWTQGPALLEALQLLDGFDLKVMAPGSPEAIHVSVEALKLAFADRDTYYADPLFADVPMSALLAPEYVSRRRSLIDLRHASLDLRPGDPRHGQALLKKADAHTGPGGPVNDTSTCLVADRLGNVVAATPSGWSGVLAGDTGVWLGSRLQSLDTHAGHPNVVEPGKRPRVTLTPTIVLKEGKPVFAVSVAGGDLQDQVTLQVLENLIDFNRSPAEAVSAPRFQTGHHIGSFRQPPPKLGSLTLDAGLPESTVEALKAMGHHVQVVKPPIAAPSALRLDLRSGRVDAAGDPRAGRHAAAP
jgi:gamma-glutamyltranspeptidase/glutathione hydrolase